MRLKLSTKIPSLTSSPLLARLKPRLERAFDLARPKIQALVVDRVALLADKELHTTAKKYVAAVQESGAVEVKLDAITIKVTKPEVIALDRGMSSFDMKRRLLAHARHFSKTGEPYVDIPFQHKASEVPAVIKQQAAARAKASGMDTVRVPGRTSGKSFTKETHRVSVFGMRTRSVNVEHKRGIHDDLIRHKATGARTARYVTIRRISGKSSPSSWLHPGFKGLRLLDKVLPMVRPDIVRVLRDSLRAAGLPVK